MRQPADPVARLPRGEQLPVLPEFAPEPGTQFPAPVATSIMRTARGGSYFSPVGFEPNESFSAHLSCSLRAVCHSLTPDFTPSDPRVKRCFPPCGPPKSDANH
jgi:hypothetical protein